MQIADSIKQHTPWFIRRISRKFKRALREKRDAHLSCEEVFTRIYKNNEWGGAAGEFYSGPGSGADAAEPYAQMVRAFIRDRQIASVVDLGCGDFRVGRTIISSGVHYTGLDIVEALTRRNQALYGNEKVEFRTANIIEDDVPAGDLCLVREVLQHLSNAQILAVLPKLMRYKYIIVTDHQPPAGKKMIPNLDKPHGQFIRLHKQSALALERPPFNLDNVEWLLDTPAPGILYDKDERLCSFLIHMVPA